jgi:single-strand DNA-binding protein
MLIGNLGRDPEIRTTQDGKSIATLNIATSKRWKNKDGEKQERTEWHRVVSFAGTLNDAVIEPYVKKGSRVYIEGELQTRKWTDKEGSDRYSTEVILNPFTGVLTMLGESNSLSRMEPTGTQDTPDDEIPF